MQAAAPAEGAERLQAPLHGCGLQGRQQLQQLQPALAIAWHVQVQSAVAGHAAVAVGQQAQGLAARHVVGQVLGHQVGQQPSAPAVGHRGVRVAGLLPVQVLDGVTLVLGHHQQLPQSGGAALLGCGGGHAGGG